MKKIGRIILTVLMGAALFIPVNELQATDFSEDEDYYSSLCSAPTSNREDQQLCIEYKEYLNNKISNIDSEIEQMQFNIETAKEDLYKMEAEIKVYTDEIKGYEATITKIENDIVKLDTDIKEKEESIEKRHKLVEDRMLEEQPTVGTNVYIEFLMGANDFVDMIRIMDGINRITERDRLLIEELQAEKDALEFTKEEQGRLRSQIEVLLKESEKSLETANALKAQQEDAIVKFQEQEALLAAAKRSIPDPSQMEGSLYVPPKDENGDVVSPPEFETNTNFIRPVNGIISHGTWAYASGGLHLGADYAAPNGTPIFAPADGIIVVTYDGCGNEGASACSVPGMWGSGNMVHLITQSNGTTYAMSFFHMYPGSVLVAPGQVVSQGQQIGSVGNSGNSYGSHCHVEVFNLGSMTVAEAVNKISARPDMSWGAGWDTAAKAPRIRPESVFP